MKLSLAVDLTAQGMLLATKIITLSSVKMEGAFHRFIEQLITTLSCEITIREVFFKLVVFGGTIRCGLSALGDENIKGRFNKRASIIRQDEVMSQPQFSIVSAMHWKPT
ncbi:MAG: hypothetical protein AB8B62_05695 [Roseobacter sp.]